MSPVTIHTYPNNTRAFKALIAAKYSHVEVNVPADFKMGVTNKTPEFLKKFPLGKVPAMETQDGPLFESNAIALYIAASKKDSPLMGKTAYEIGLNQQFISVADSYIAPACGAWVMPILGYIPFDQASCDKAQADLKAQLTILNATLEDKTFLVGHRVTLADIIMVCTLLDASKLVLDPTFRKPFGNVFRWFTTCINQPEFKAVLGDFKLCEKAMKFGDKLPVAEKPASKPAPARAKDDDLEEDDEPAEPKKKNPLDLLPPSKFNLDDWKRFYSNNETRPTAIDYFWANFDKEGFSIWKSQYKYSHELTKVFMTCNLVGGFFQRIDRARKYAFGSVVICGTDNKNEISGYWVFRGQDVPEEVRESDDFESFEFSKMNSDDSKVRQEFNDYLAWDGHLVAKQFNQGKIFK